MIWRSVWSEGVGSANEHFFRAIPAAGVILLARERNKRKRKPGKEVMEMLRQISSPSTFLFRSGRILSLLRCDEPWKTLVLSSSRARDTSSTRLLLAFYFILVSRVLYHPYSRLPFVLPRLFPRYSIVRFTLAVSTRSKVWVFKPVRLRSSLHYPLWTGIGRAAIPSFLCYTLIIIFGASFAWYYGCEKLIRN